MSDETPKAPGLPHVDVREYGGKKDGVAQSLDERLFMQLLAFSAREHNVAAAAVTELASALAGARVPAVVYEDANDPRGLALLTWSTDPDHFVTKIRPILHQQSRLAFKPEYTMLGRTYSQGYEPDLAYWILRRPIENVTNPALKWHVWYPLRRSGAFSRLSDHDQGIILKEHASIGRAYGEQDLAHDIRLACHGLDTHDNDFVIGLLGKTLHPLSHVVQAMRKTRQTSEYIAHMGPFFVGRVAWQSRGAATSIPSPQP